MRWKYDFRLKEEANEIICPNSVKSEGEFERLLQKKREMDVNVRYVYSKTERKRFEKIIPVIQKYAFVQSAVLIIDLGMEEGRFFLEMQDMCFCSFHVSDKAVLDYMKKQISFINIENGKIQLEIIASFKKRKTKIWKAKSRVNPQINWI